MCHIFKLLQYIWNIICWLFKKLIKVCHWLIIHPWVIFYIYLFIALPALTARWLFWKDVDISVYYHATPSSTILVEIDNDRLLKLNFKNTLRRAFQTPFDLGYYNLCFVNNHRLVKDTKGDTSIIARLAVSTTIQFRESNVYKTKSYDFKDNTDPVCDDFNIPELEILGNTAIAFPAVFQITVTSSDVGIIRIINEITPSSTANPSKIPRRVSAILLISTILGALMLVIGIVKLFHEAIHHNCDDCKKLR